MSSKTKKFKLYTHHHSFLKLREKSKNPFARLLSKLGNLFFSVFYGVGAAVLAFIRFLKFICGKIIGSAAYFFKRGVNTVVGDIIKTRNLFPARLKIFKTNSWARNFLVFILLTALGFSAIAGLRAVAGILIIKSDTEQDALLGGSYLFGAQQAMSSQDLNLAQNRLNKALEFFGNSQTELASGGLAINQILNLYPQKQDAAKLLKAASLVAQAGQNFISLENSAKTIRISQDGIISQGQPTAEVLRDVNNQLASALSDLSQANSLVGQVNLSGLPPGDRQTFTGLTAKLGATVGALKDADNIFVLAQNLIEGNKNLLILFENNNELRPGGGFMGTFGSLQLGNGQINKINVSSIYDLDGQLKEVIQPPLPILNVSRQWYLRDSNWFADFPFSAQKISWFYQQEGGAQPDLIVAMTPNLITDLLKVTGPVFMPKYNITLTPDNFVEETQAISTISDDMPTNSPKQILADLVPVLLQKISSQGKDGWSQILQILQSQLAQKQLVFYAKDPALEKQLAAFDWTGSVAPSDRDYLLVLNSNLGGTKTDLAVDQKTQLVSLVAADGSITDQLTITRTNNNPNLPDNSNVDFLRVYVPQGSQLISNSGFDKKDLDYSATGTPYQIDSDVYNWQKDLLTDNLTGTMIGQEAGKTFFGNWIVLDPGQSKTVKLVYQLPFKLNSVDRFSLLLQKQIGSLNQNFSWNVTFPGRRILWSNFSPSQPNPNSADSDIIADKDYLLGMVLQKQ